MKQKLKVLLVEDSEDDAFLLSRELIKGGFDTSYKRVYTPEALNEALDGNGWDIIFSDHSMPNFSAPRALEILKERGLDIPFILVSGAMGEEAAVEIIKAGANDYIKKGNWSRLIPTVERELAAADERVELALAEDALRESRDLMEKVLDSAGDIIFSLDSYLCVTSWNKVAERVLGYNKAGVLGKRLGDIEGFSEAVELQETMQRPLTSPVDIETVLKTRKGIRKVIKFLITPLLDNTGYVFSGMDITLLENFQKRIIQGRSYLIKDDGIEKAATHLKALKDSGFEIMVITRRTVDELEDNWNLGATYFRMAEVETRDHQPVKDPENIRVKIKEFLKNHPRSVILLDRLDYLITLYGFNNLLPLVYHINDIISASESIFLVNIPEGLLGERDNLLLEQELQDIPLIGEGVREDLPYDVYNILKYISENNEPNLTDIAEKFGITRPTVNKKVKELKRQGLITTRQMGRYTVLALTEEGRHLV